MPSMSSDVEMKDQNAYYNSYDPVQNELLETADFDITLGENLDTFTVQRSPSQRHSSISRSLLARSSIKDSPEYIVAIRKERYIIIFLLLVVVTLGPLVFRFCLGASTGHSDNDNSSSWGARLDSCEWFLLVVIFINMVGFIIRLLPVVCGKPATIESVKNCSLEGSSVLCVCSPFCAEDDVLLIRNLLGRTCTLFATVNGRHDINGLYLDATLNERRLKGEANRRNIFTQWLVFVTTLIKLCQKKNISKANHLARHASSTADMSGAPPRGRFNSWAKYGQSVFDVATGGLTDVSTFNRAIVVDRDDEVRIRSSTLTADWHAPQANPFPVGRGDVEDCLQAEEKCIPTIVDTQPGDKNIRDLLDKLEVDIDVIQPVVSFLNHWLKEMKNNEKLYSYGDKASESLDQLFLAAPFVDYFEGENLLVVHSALQELYNAVTTYVPDEADPGGVIFPDSITEVEWVIHRKASPNWTVVWSLLSRSKLRPANSKHVGAVHIPEPKFDVTDIIPGAIVYCVNDLEVNPKYVMNTFLKERMKTYKVIAVIRRDGQELVKLTAFPPVLGDYRSTEVRLANVRLLELNRGKAGALNFCNMYIRAKMTNWAHKIGIKNDIQTFVGIVDARHAIVEPDVFWNDALPFFSTQKDSLKPSRSFGFGTDHQQDYPVCITVQYPQYFSNVAHNDYLDNGNIAYYNLWQVLRDMGKCVTSSGTNTIWDISDRNFVFCTETRSEDLGTSHQYIPHSVSVYLCCFVAYGIAKKKEDYLEALYRWAAGPLELMWKSFFRKYMLWHYIAVLVPFLITVNASFSKDPRYYYLYLTMVLVFFILALVDKLRGRKPLRPFVVSTVICSNLCGWISNFTSLAWVLVLPIRIGMFSTAPFLMGDRYLFWGLSTLVFGLPMTVFNDAMIRIALLASPASRSVDLYMALWRGTQLYACSFMYNAMAVVAGTYSALKAAYFKRDLSVWTSFKVPGSAMDNARNKIWSSSCCGFVPAYVAYLSLVVKSYFYGLFSPTTMTRFYVNLLFLVQVVCVLVSTLHTNTDKYVSAILLLATCSVNVCTIYQIAFLMEPNLKWICGFPIRVDVMYGYVGVVMVATAIIANVISTDEFIKALNISTQ